METSGNLDIGPCAKVLVLEDEPLIATWLSRALSGVGHSVRSVHTGAAFFDFVAAEPDWAQVVLLDMSLPDIRGPQVYEQYAPVREDLSWIILTGNVHDPEIAEFERSGHQVLGKPARVSEVRGAVARCLAVEELT